MVLFLVVLLAPFSATSKKPVPVSVPQPLKVKIKCNLREAIELGGYEVVSGYALPAYFPTPMLCKDGAEVSIRLFQYDPDFDDWMARLMIKEGYRPATLREILAIGISHPELQRQFHIVALGSSILGPDGAPIVPFIGESGKRRSLNFASYSKKWDSKWRFAAIQFRK
jgi:hypothetical protein